ncbi:MAG: methionyl-tRNA formyltransferase [Actinobacteria bacterium]|nr:methionyl-tRNA formyltransferase [Actinomycetota bacterium]
MRLLFAGTPKVAVATLDALLESGHEVVAVLTRPDALAGRGRRLVASAVAQRATELGLRLMQPDRPTDPDFLADLEILGVDVAPIVAYGGLIPPAALALPRNGWINLHFSLLPAWRGAAPVQRAIMAGDDITGASTFILEEGLDTGPVLGVVTETIRPTDTSGDVLARLALSGAELMVRTLDAIEEGVAVPSPQPNDGISLAPRITTDEVRIDWTRPALAIDRLVRGATPEPGAWTTLRGQRLGVGPVKLLVDDTSLVAGQLGVDRAGIRVGTGSHAVLLGEVKPAGKRWMPASDWARGARLSESEVVE